MLSWSINLFRIRGIQLSLHVSFLLLLAYFGVEGYADGGVPAMLWSMSFLVAFFACVVLHELGHSLTGMRFGVVVRRILLMPIGGMAQFDSIPRQPWREFLMTIAGPAVNFAIAALLWFPVSFPASWDPDSSPASLGDLGRLLLIGNLYMGVFNLLPAFPMDGGRMMRAFLASRMSYVRATFWAATVGKVLASTGIILALWFPQYIPFIPAERPQYLLAILFAFILMAGEGEYRAVRQRELLEQQWREFAARITFAPPPPPESEPPLLHDPNG